MIENQYNPDSISPPGQTIAELLKERGMTPAELAEQTSQPINTITEIIQGKTAITSDIASQLERVFGVPAGFWNNRERNYQEWLARQSKRRAEVR